MTEPTPRILVVDDEPSLSRALKINLSARGYQVITAADAGAALRAMADAHVDLVLLDLGLPDADGMEVLAGIRGWSSVPIIVLSARQAADDKVEALDAGADDYVTKPFELTELLARIRAGLRHRREAPAEPVLSAGELQIDLARSIVERSGTPVRLTPTEWRLLEILARHPDTLVSQARLLAEVWGPGYEKETHYLRTYFATLRRKLEADPARPVHLITEPGLGYRLITGSAAAGDA